MTSLKDTYIQYGVPNNWASKYNSIGISAATVKITSSKNLVNKYKIPIVEIKFVKKCLLREPIKQSVVQKLILNNRGVCCICKGQKSDAFIIHHIKEYSKSQDNKYSNLALLCPNDHELTHRGLQLSHRYSPIE